LYLTFYLIAADLNTSGHIFDQMKRYGEVADENNLAPYPEVEGDEVIYLAVGSSLVVVTLGVAFHWRIQWRAFDANTGQFAGWKIIEVLTPDNPNEFEFRYYFRSSFHETLSRYQLYELGRLNQESREALPTLAHQMEPPQEYGGDCRSCTQKLARELVRYSLFKQSTVEAAIQSGYHQEAVTVRETTPLPLVRIHAT
jgi:hypothetical protein